MKTTVLLLVASVALNAALVGLWWKRTREAPPDQAAVSQTGSGSRHAPPSAKADVRSALPDASWHKELLAAVASGDHTAVRRLMARTGLPESVARSLLRALVFRTYEQRRREIYAAKLAQQPNFWRRMPGTDGLSAQERAELRNLQRTAQALSREFTGPDEPDSALDLRRYDFLAQDKAARLNAIDRDYADLFRDLQQEVSRFRVQGDEARWRLLRDERERDLAALLTPEERRLYELHNSESAQRLRCRVGYFDASEEEFSRMYELHKAFDEKWEKNSFELLTSVSSQSADYLGERRRAQAQLEEEVRRALGDARYQELLRSQTLDYRQLQAAGDRFGVAEPTLDLAWAARERAIAAVSQIEESKSMTADERRNALAGIAGQARASVLAALGEAAGSAYLRNAMGWLKSLDGGVVPSRAMFNDSGVVVTTISVGGGVVVSTIRTASPTPLVATPATPGSLRKKG